MGELIAFLSGKGGTGKTSVCAGVAEALADAGCSVLCIDCDVGLRNLDISLGMADCDTLSFLDVSEGGYSLSQAAENPYYTGLYLLTAPVGRSVASISENAFSLLLSQAKKQYHYVLLDAPAGIDKGFQLAAKYADRVLLVTGADPAAMRDAAQTGQMLELMGKNDVRLIVNRINRKMTQELSLTIDDVMDQTGLPLMGVVPEDPGVILAATFGRPILIYSPGKRGASGAFRRIASRIEGMPTPLLVR